MTLATLLLGGAFANEFWGEGVLGSGQNGLLMMCLIVSVAFLLVRVRVDVPMAGAVLSPLVAAALCALGLKAMGVADAAPVAGELGTVTILHISATLLGFLFFVPAYVLSLLFLDQEYHLRSKTKAPSGLPSLLRLEKTAWQLIYLGFPLFSLGILLGFIWQENTPEGIALRPQHLLAGLGWVLYAHATWRHVRTGWRGRRAALELMAAFVLTLTAVLLYVMR